MFQHIVRFAVTKKLFVGLTTLFLLAGGIYAMLTLPVDAVPDITNNQVQIVTVSPTLAPQEVEQLITFPIEVAMSNIMNVVEIRSVSRFGLSVVTVVFKESVPILDARQLINEQIQTVAGEIPPELGTPEMMPITTGLGEIYQYTLDVAPGYEDRYDAMELRTIQDWIVKRQLSGIPGIVEINSFGGYLKQYEVAVDPDALYSLNITIGDVFEVLSRNNQNTGGSYIEKVNRAYYIRSEGMISSLDDIRQIVVAKIGTAEVPTDPMAVEDADVMIVMKPFAEWTSASSRAEMVEKMKAALDTIPGAEFNFSQPIQLRFNELMTGAKADIAIKLYGEDMAELYAKAKEAARYVEQVPGASDVLVEQAMGLPQLVVNYNRAKIARYGINIEELNSIIRSAYAGETAGTVFENERRFDLVVRLDQRKVADLNLDRLFIRTAEGIQIPVSEVATIDLVNGPLQINRDATKRRVVIGVNVRDADIQQVVAAIRRTLEENVQLKPGYYFEYGGQFENLQNAIRTLLVVIPVALMLILLLLFFAFKSVTYTLVVFSTVPLSIIGGILALWLRGLPFSISAGVGFIALFGVAVLNGILMINHFNDLRDMTPYPLSTRRIIARGTQHLLRPVFLTGLVASLGFVPMAIATSAGAEVQRPLATVVIGGLFVSTLLTLFVVPVFYKLVGAASLLRRHPLVRRLFPFLLLPALLLLPLDGHSQQRVTLDEAVAMALDNHPRLQSAEAAVERTKARRGESWELAPTTVDYSFGQLNGTERSSRQRTSRAHLSQILARMFLTGQPGNMASSTIVLFIGASPFLFGRIGASPPHRHHAAQKYMNLFFIPNIFYKQIHGDKKPDLLKRSGSGKRPSRRLPPRRAAIRDVRWRAGTPSCRSDTASRPRSGCWRPAATATGHPAGRSAEPSAPHGGCTSRAGSPRPAAAPARRSESSGSRPRRCGSPARPRATSGACFSADRAVRCAARNAPCAPSCAPRPSGRSESLRPASPVPVRRGTPAYRERSCRRRHRPCC